ncbi:MAG: TrmH family RNA methyltransferase [Chloroflexota bacterium]
MRITSTRNPLVQFVRSLARPAERRSHGAYLIEGVRLVQEAIHLRQLATLVLYDPDVLLRTAPGSSLVESLAGWAERTQAVAPHVLAAAAQTETPSGVVAVLRLPEPAPLADHGRDRLGLILDGLADPGNAGAILRTADAFACGYVVTTPGTTDLFAPKVVRAGMGAHFRLPLYQHLDWRELRAALPTVALVGADADKGEPVQTFAWPDTAGLVIGGEAHGLSSEARADVSALLRIPMRAGVESLNAGAAASILLFAADSAPSQQV